jgi:hypothetical protein
MTVILHEDKNRFMIIRHLVHFRITHVSFKSCRETCFRNSCRLWDNVKTFCRNLQVTADSIILHIRLACWVPKAIDTYLPNLMRMVFPGHQCWRERALLCHTCTACLDVSTWFYICRSVVCTLCMCKLNNRCLGGTELLDQGEKGGGLLERSEGKCLLCNESHRIDCSENQGCRFLCLKTDDNRNYIWKCTYFLPHIHTTSNPGKRAAADPPLRPRGRWGRL